MSWRVLLCDGDGNVIEDLTASVWKLDMTMPIDQETYDALLGAYYSHCPGCGEQFFPDVYHACAQAPFEI